MTQFQSPRFHVTLPTHTVFALDDAAQVAIECRSGSVWVTLDNDPRDIVLTPGQRFDGTAHQRALVSALESSCISVSSLQPIDVPWPAPFAAASRRAATAGGRSRRAGVAHGMSPA